MFQLVIFLAIAVAGSQASASDNTFVANSGRTLYISGHIDTGILKTALTLNKMTEVSQFPVSIIIDSPGGSLVAGLQFVEAIQVAKARGVVVRCFVPRIAASMAMIIFNTCHSRFALSKAMFLWHPPRFPIGGPSTINNLEVAISRGKILASGIDDSLIAGLGISRELYFKYSVREMLIPATHLQEISPKYLKIVDDFKGVGGSSPL